MRWQRGEEKLAFFPAGLREEDEEGMLVAAWWDDGRSDSGIENFRRKEDQRGHRPG